MALAGRFLSGRLILRIYKRSAISFVERQLISYEDQMTCHCISSIPNCLMVNPPFQGRGAVSFANECGRNFTCTLNLLEKYNNQ